MPALVWWVTGAAVYSGQVWSDAAIVWCDVVLEIYPQQTNSHISCEAHKYQYYPKEGRASVFLSKKTFAISLHFWFKVCTCKYCSALLPAALERNRILPLVCGLCFTAISHVKRIFNPISLNFVHITFGVHYCGNTVKFIGRHTNHDRNLTGLVW